MNGIDMTRGSIFKKLLRVSVPIIFANLIQMVYTLTDMFWLGQVSQEALSAAGAMGLFVWLGISIITMPKVATEVMVSQAFGKKDYVTVSQYSTNGLILSFILAFMYSATLFIFKNQIIGLFDFESIIIIEMARQYLTISCFTIFLLMLVNLYISVYNGVGNTKTVFYFLALCLIINMILDPIMILKLDFGVKGAAIATLAATFIGMVLFWYYSRYKDNDYVNFRSDIDFQKLKNLVILGFFPMITQVVFCFTFIIMSIYIVRFGDENIAVSQIGSQVEALTWIIGAAATTAITVFTGQNISVKNYLRITKGFTIVMTLMVLYSLLVSALFIFFGEEIFLLFLPSEHTTAKLGGNYLFINAFIQSFMMAEAVITGFFNGQGKTKAPAVITIIGNIIRIPMFIILGDLYGVNGVWIAISISILIKGIALIVLFIRSVIMHSDFKLRKFIFLKEENVC